jgi:hypothetical protein
MTGLFAATRTFGKSCDTGFRSTRVRNACIELEIGRPLLRKSGCRPRASHKHGEDTADGGRIDGPIRVRIAS